MESRFASFDRLRRARKNTATQRLIDGVGHRRLPKLATVVAPAVRVRKVRREIRISAAPTCGIFSFGGCYQRSRRESDTRCEWGDTTVRFDSGNSATRQKPLDIYLGFEIVRDSDDRYIAIPQGWAGSHARELEAPDLPTLRKLIWEWWFNLPG